MDVFLKDVGHLYGHLEFPAYESRSYQNSYVFPLQSTKDSGLELVQQLVLVVRRRVRDIGDYISYRYSRYFCVKCKVLYAARTTSVGRTRKQRIHYKYDTSTVRSITRHIIRYVHVPR